jgi:putative sugar O-methyltransferase
VPLKQATSILDIGGGFACLLARIGQLFPHLNLYFCELPKLCLVATYYLRQRPDLQNPSRRVHVMFPWEYSTFSEKVDVVINTMSFHHMNEANLNYYFSRFRALNVQTVFTINREQALRRGEVASFIPHMERAGYKLNARYSLEPWRTLHVLHIWCKNA